MAELEHDTQAVVFVVLCHAEPCICPAFSYRYFHEFRNMFGVGVPPPLFPPHLDRKKIMGNIARPYPLARARRMKSSGCVCEQVAITFPGAGVRPISDLLVLLRRAAARFLSGGTDHATAESRSHDPEAQGMYASRVRHVCLCSFPQDDPLR